MSETLRMPESSYPENEVRDHEVFESLDPDWPGLEPVISAYRDGRLEQAKKELMLYFRRRESPKWYFDYRLQSENSVQVEGLHGLLGETGSSADEGIDGLIREADRLCRHQFMGAVPFDLGERLDRFPLFDLNQKDNKPLRVTANRFVRMNFIRPLLAAHLVTGDSRYAETFARLIAAFTGGLLERHPYAPDPVESTEAYTIHFSKNPFRSNMSVGQSVIHIVNAMYTDVLYADCVPAELSFRLFRYAWYIMLHHRSYDRNRYRHYNHHLFERGVMPLLIGTMFPEFPVLRPLLERGKAVILEHLEQDFHPSGGYDEHSIAYTCATTMMEFVAPVKVLTELNGIEGLEAAWTWPLRRAYSFYSSLVMPDGTLPDIGDNGGGPARPFLEQGYRMYRSETAGAVLAALDLGSERRTERGPGYEHLLPPLTVNDPLSGYCCTRDDWTPDANCMVMSNKAYTRHCSHNHLDMLSLIIAVRGEKLVGEPQAPILYKYISNGSELDEYTRGLGGHNSVLIAGQPLTKSILRRADRLPSQAVRTETVQEEVDWVYIQASHDAYAFARHTREVLHLRRQGWRIRDTIEWLNGTKPKEGIPHIQRWHLEHGVRAEEAGGHGLLLIGRRARLLCVWPESAAVSFQLWRNEAVLELEGVPRYRKPSDLPWVVDVCYPPSDDTRRDRLECLLLDITDESDELETQVKRCMEQLNAADPRMASGPMAEA